MLSFSAVVKPDHLGEEAVDLSQSIDYTAPPGHKARKTPTSAENGGAYELHPLPEYFTEPSVLRNDSTTDITLTDLVPEQSSPVLGNVHLKSCIAAATSTGVVVPLSTIKRRLSNLKGRRATGGRQIFISRPSVGAFSWLNLIKGFVLGAGANVRWRALSHPFRLWFWHALAGFGIALQNAQGNGLIGSLKEHKTTKLNTLHAAYGEQSIVIRDRPTLRLPRSWRVCFTISRHPLSYERHWPYHFIISAGIAVSNSVVLALVFRFKTQEGELSGSAT
ncbi:hypothetical protein ARMGADRAFT_1023819 [Armillaria gallica]|uniref:Uncharacterized protein n=1 Tax=Armillaria gallica TaxID=47427 RepID=A0A2H3EPM7_ARMGA|nr:hypothetical protein ARMGADRAFT_1023819 [Armillaria gallica]